MNNPHPPHPAKTREHFPSRLKIGWGWGGWITREEAKAMPVSFGRSPWSNPQWLITLLWGHWSQHLCSFLWHPVHGLRCLQKHKCFWWVNSKFQLPMEWQFQKVEGSMQSGKKKKKYTIPTKEWRESFSAPEAFPGWTLESLKYFFLKKLIPRALLQPILMRMSRGSTQAQLFTSFQVCFNTHPGLRVTAGILDKMLEGKWDAK